MCVCVGGAHLPLIAGSCAFYVYNLDTTCERHGSGSDFLYYRVKNQTDIFTGVPLSFFFFPKNPGGSSCRSLLVPIA